MGFIGDPLLHGRDQRVVCASLSPFAVLQSRSHGVRARICMNDYSRYAESREWVLFRINDLMGIFQ